MLKTHHQSGMCWTILLLGILLLTACMPETVSPTVSTPRKTLQLIEFYSPM